MESVGLIQMACYCGADLFYIGDGMPDQDSDKLVQKLKHHFGIVDIGIFTSSSGKYGECPFCGLLYELPDPELMEWLPFIDANSFFAALTDMKRAGLDNLNTLQGGTHPAEYLS